MEKSLEAFDWSLVQAFLAVAETGSLSGAARQLKVSQPTIGRQIHALEAALGASLFQRRSRGMSLTATGAALYAPAQAMQEGARQIDLIAAGEAQSIAGSVRVTASVYVAHHVLPPIFAQIRQAEPEITLDLVASDETENLLYREADIAIRMYRPTQLDLVTKHLGDVQLGLFAAKSYLDRRGRPNSPEDLLALDFVGYDRNEEIIRGFREGGWDVGRDFFKVRCDHHTVYWELVRAGCGLGFSQALFADPDPSVEQVELGIPIPGLPVWLTAHEAIRRTPRVRRVWQLLEAGLSRLVS
ncbi:MAG: LysR family transcriptional regulator [Rhodobacteraceae bacterium]|nr:LysR family transcriptional regulator [Paracoccaceae bacterium]